MLRKEIKITDLNGDPQVVVAYFNISKAESIDMNFSTPGGLEAHIKRMIEANDTVQTYALFREIVLKSFGVKSPDGQRFMKKDENGRQLCEAFEESPAFGELIIELMSDEDKTAAFINAVVPDMSYLEDKVKSRQDVAPMNVIPLNQ